MDSALSTLPRLVDPDCVMGGKKNKKETSNWGQSRSNNTATGKKEKADKVKSGKSAKALKGAQKLDTSHLLVLILQSPSMRSIADMVCWYSTKSVESRMRLLLRSKEERPLTKFLLLTKTQTDLSRWKKNSM